MPIKINGATSGSTTITAPATGSDESIELSTALASKLDLAGGKILQIVRATDGSTRTTTSATFVDVTGLSVTITPSLATSAVLLIASVQVQSTGANGYGRIQITDSSNNAISGSESSTFGDSAGSNPNSLLTAIAYATPATTSATTYKLRFRKDSGTDFRCVNSVTTGQIYALEVSA